MPARWNGAGTGDTALVEQLLDLGVAMGAVDIAGYTPVAWAAAGGHAPCVSLLLEAGSGVGAADNEGRLPLHWAAERGFAQVVALLVPAMLQSGLDLNALVSSSLALTACSSDTKCSLRALIPGGTSNNYVTQFLWISLILCRGNTGPMEGLCQTVLGICMAAFGLKEVPLKEVPQYRFLPGQ